MLIKLGVAKAWRAAVIAEDGCLQRSGHLGEIDSDPTAVDGSPSRQAAWSAMFLLQGGSIGYGLYQWLIAMAYQCVVVASTLISRRLGDCVRTNSRHRQLARRPRTRELTPVSHKLLYKNRA